MSKVCVSVLALLGFCLGFTGAAPAEQLYEDRGDLTVVTADRLVFDYSKQYALFEGNVVVNDPSMSMKADTLMIKFSEESDVQTILAKGSVVIEQEDKRAEANVASYDVVSGKVELKENPVVRRGRDILTGDVITFWRDENKMVCEPARFIIFPGEGGPRSKLIGD